MDLVAAKRVSRFSVFLINLDPTVGKEIQKTRPCLIVSPDEMNHYISTVIIAPMTTTLRDYPSRITCTFQGKTGQIVLDQIRTVDKIRLVKELGIIDPHTQHLVAGTLTEMFAF
ncbi:MAG TPA: type II toxin-antitoxin system PemK/MazF family toxin [Calditrichia bacterium]|nr:type II toxin-antitoxin system PemK/MazF family toxin [Calditrichia bacterium]